jgi:hypothetical protein
MVEDVVGLIAANITTEKRERRSVETQVYKVSAVPVRRVWRACAPVHPARVRLAAALSLDRAFGAQHPDRALPDRRRVPYYAAPEAGHGLIRIKEPSRVCCHFCHMAAFVFRCPNTTLRVQGWIACDVPNGETFEPVQCTACARVHYVNPITGKVLGEDEDAASS